MELGSLCPGALAMISINSAQISLIHAWWRAANYRSVGQVHLLDNQSLRRPLAIEMSNRDGWSLGRRMDPTAAPN